jgi:hypothetical protein
MSEEFHIGAGGPFHRIERATKLDSLQRIVTFSLLVTWAPLIVLAVAQWFISHRFEPMLRDLSVHARLLVTLPLLFIADRVLDERCYEAVRQLFDQGFVPPDQQPRVRRILASAEHWRDSPLPEGVFLLLAIASGVASLTGLIAPGGFVSGLAASTYGAVRVWYALISLPIFQFVLWRSLFRWALWARVLFDLSGVPLRLSPGHADGRAGIAFLKRPTIAYCTVLLLAVSTALCAGWETQILLEGRKVDTLKPLFFAFLLIGAVIAFAPLLCFVPSLFRARRRGRLTYASLVTTYSRAFEKRWTTTSSPTDLLGNADFQSMADLSSTFRDNVEKMQLVLFGARDCIALVLAAQIPGLPIMLSQLPANEVLKRILHLVMPG